MLDDGICSEAGWCGTPVHFEAGLDKKQVFHSLLMPCRLGCRVAIVGKVLGAEEEAQVVFDVSGHDPCFQ